MPTSNTTSYTISAADCIRMALEDINIVGQGDSVTDYDYGIAENKLNLMIKSWQNQAEHLWVRQKIILFLQKAQSAYEISLTSTDNVTADEINSTQLTANAIVGATTITVSSSVGFAASDKIGIQLDSGYFFWTTVVNVLSATSIQITNPFASTATAGLYVFGYTNRLTTVFNPYSATRHLITSTLDTPLLFQSYLDYTNMPNKVSLGAPNMWSYDRQIDKLIINIWQNPSDVSYYLNFVVDRKIQDMNVNDDDFDFPQEWGEAIELNLAVKLAPVYGKAQGENFAKLEQQAQESLMRAMENDNELGSIYIMPSRSGLRGR